MASGSLSTEELVEYARAREHDRNLFTNIGRSGLALEPGTPVYDLFESPRCWPTNILTTLDAAHEMGHRELVESIGAYASGRIERGERDNIKLFVAIQQRATNFLTGQQG